MVKFHIPLYIVLLVLGLWSCHDMRNTPFSEPPSKSPIPFMPEIIPEGALVHRGIFSPALNEYYFTVSDQKFEKFDVYVMRWEGTNWSAAEVAPFNSEYNDHGTSFSPDGDVVYFSSTRPAPSAGVVGTWHIWRSVYVYDEWAEPEFVDIPNMRDRLVSHPSLSRDGVMYFHAGNPDYSDLDIYSSQLINGAFQDAVRLSSSINSGDSEVTPFVSPDGTYLLFERAPDLYISQKDGRGQWTPARRLPEKINIRGKGNPFVTSDGKYLFYVAGNKVRPGEHQTWHVFWVLAECIFEKK
jgi:hypothetical protein